MPKIPSGTLVCWTRQGLGPNESIRCTEFRARANSVSNLGRRRWASISNLTFRGRSGAINCPERGFADASASHALDVSSGRPFYCGAGNTAAHRPLGAPERTPRLRGGDFGILARGSLVGRDYDDARGKWMCVFGHSAFV